MEEQWCAFQAQPEVVADESEQFGILNSRHESLHDRHGQNLSDGHAANQSTP